MLAPAVLQIDLHGGVEEIAVVPREKDVAQAEAPQGGDRDPQAGAGRLGEQAFARHALAGKEGVLIEAIRN